MTQEEKIALLEDMLELDTNTLSPDTELKAIEEYEEADDRYYNLKKKHQEKEEINPLPFGTT